MDEVAKLKSVISHVVDIYEQGKVEVFNEEAQELIRKCGRNELMAIGCKIVHWPTGKEYIELPYDGLSKKRLNKLFVQLGTSAYAEKLDDMLPVDWE